MPFWTFDNLGLHHEIGLFGYAAQNAFNFTCFVYGNTEAIVVDLPVWIFMPVAPQQRRVSPARSAASRPELGPTPSGSDSTEREADAIASERRYVSIIQNLATQMQLFPAFQVEQELTEIAEL